MQACLAQLRSNESYHMHTLTPAPFCGCQMTGEVHPDSEMHMPHPWAQTQDNKILLSVQSPALLTSWPGASLRQHSIRICCAEKHSLRPRGGKIKVIHATRDTRCARSTRAKWREWRKRVE